MKAITQSGIVLASRKIFERSREKLGLYGQAAVLSSSGNNFDNIKRSNHAQQLPVTIFSQFQKSCSKKIAMPINRAYEIKEMSKFSSL